MRRLVATAVTVGIAAAALIDGSASAGPAQTYNCPDDGGGPVSSQADRTVMVGTGDRPTVYIDDRGFIDPLYLARNNQDNNPKSGGTWIYFEDNDVQFLQRGGAQLENVAGVPIEVPFIPETATPVGTTLFPGGFGGGSVAEETGGYDACGKKWSPDKGNYGKYWNEKKVTSAKDTIVF